jgi:hypothetical protein
MGLAFWSRFPLLRLAGVARRAWQSLPPREEPRRPEPAAPPPLAEKQSPLGFRLEVEVVETAEGVTVRLRGKAGIAEARTLQAALLRLSARRPACVTFDLRELLFISSLVMGVLVEYRRAAGRR